MRDKPLLLIVGHSGVGKTAILRASGLTEVVSDTSREMRKGEVDGVDYNFRGRMEIEMDWQKHKQKRAKIYSYDPPKLNYSNYYCAKDSEILTKDAMVIDLESAKKLRGMIDSVIVWIDGPQRDTRGRTEQIPISEFQICCDYKVWNYGTVEQGVKSLLRAHSDAIDLFNGNRLRKQLNYHKNEARRLERELYNKGRN